MRYENALRGFEQVVRVFFPYVYDTRDRQIQNKTGPPPFFRVFSSFYARFFFSFYWIFVDVRSIYNMRMIVSSLFWIDVISIEETKNTRSVLSNDKDE